MARAISEFDPQLGSLVASGDLFGTVDISEAVPADRNKTLTRDEIMSMIKLNLWNVIKKTEAYTASSYDEIFTDTVTIGAFTITLPLNPSNGNRVKVKDVATSWATETLTIDPNGQTIEGGGSYSLTTADGWAEFVFNSADSTWEVYLP
jgi:hypothetical protein